MTEIIYGHFVFKETDDPYPELTKEMIKYAKKLLDEMQEGQDLEPEL